MPELIEHANYHRAIHPAGIDVRRVPRILSNEPEPESRAEQGDVTVTVVLCNPPWQPHWQAFFQEDEPARLMYWDGGAVFWNTSRANPSPAEKTRFDEFRKKLEEFRRLQKGWDSYDAEPPSAKACVLAERLLSALEAVSLPPEYVVPTSDGSVMLKHRVGGAEVTWEIDEDGEIGVMEERAGIEPKYHSPSESEMIPLLVRLVCHG